METNYLIIFSYDSGKSIEKFYCTIDELKNNFKWLMDNGAEIISINKLA